MKPSIYLSGPISLGGTLSEDDVAANKQRFADARALLEARGHVVFDPTCISGASDWKWETWMRAALTMMLRAEMVVLLPGWSASIGSRIEVATASALMPVTMLAEVAAAEPAKAEDS